MFFNKYYDKKYGKIIASAVRKGGVVYTGATHADCLRQAPMGTLRDAEQGFLTDTRLFVNRKKALRIAKHYKQIVKKHPPYNQLMSEDMLHF